MLTWTQNRLLRSRVSDFFYGRTARRVKQENKQLKKDYQQRPLAMGIFLIRNNLNDRVFVGSGLNLQDRKSVV